MTTQADAEAVRAACDWLLAQADQPVDLRVGSAYRTEYRAKVAVVQAAAAAGARARVEAEEHALSLARELAGEVIDGSARVQQAEELIDALNALLVSEGRRDG